MDRRTLIPILLVGCCFTSIVFASEPNDYIRPGKSYMLNGTLSGLRQAYQLFNDGINDLNCPQCATSRELIFLHAVTRTAMVFIDNNNIPIDSFLEVAEKFGVQVLGDFFEELDVNVPLTNDHYKIPPTAPGPDEISNFFSNKVVDWITEVNDIIADLNSISDSPSDRFRIFFEPNDTGLENNLEVDYGEVWILKGLLLAFKGMLEARMAYDVFLNVNQPLLYDLLYVHGIDVNDFNDADCLELLRVINIDVDDPNQLSINDHFLEPYPDLLKVLPTPNYPDVNGAAILAQARQDWIAAINYYFDAVDYIASEDANGIDPQEDELLYIDPNNQLLLDTVEDRLTALRDSLVNDVNDTNMLYPVQTSKTYNVYDSNSNLISQLMLVYDFTCIGLEDGTLTFTDTNDIPSPWESEYEFLTGPEISLELESYAAGGWYEGYFEAALSKDGNSFSNGTFEYWGWDEYGNWESATLTGLTGKLIDTDVEYLNINFNPIFGSTARYPVNPRDLLPLFDEENIPIACTFGHGLGNDATLGGILPDMTQQDWTILFDLVPSDPLYIVNFEDFARFAELWLYTGEGLTGDLDGDNDVDLLDLRRFADYWLDCCPYNWPLK